MTPDEELLNEQNEILHTEVGAGTFQQTYFFEAIAFISDYFQAF